MTSSWIILETKKCVNQRLDSCQWLSSNFAVKCRKPDLAAGQVTHSIGRKILNLCSHWWKLIS